jgi:hypothetical protein
MGFLICYWILFFQTLHTLASCANVYLIQPNKGSQIGGTQVSVYGTGFSSRSTSCRFSSVPVTCRFISTSKLICTSPTYPSTESVTVEVSVDSSGSPETFTNDKILFRYQGFGSFHELSEVSFTLMLFFFFPQSRHQLQVFNLRRDRSLEGPKLS